MYEPRHIPASHRLSAWLLSALFVLSLCLQQAWAAPAERTVIPLGQAVGIKLFADGVLVVALADGPTPAHACGLRQGDIITAMDGAAVGSTEQVQDLLADTAGAPIVLSVRRGADALALTACARENNGVWQLGAWIRDSMAGIGTLTYYDPATGQYGALGHGIADVDTAQLMPLASGAIMETTVKAVKKGAKGDPGELKGDFSVQRDVGAVTVNSSGGIFGTVADPDSSPAARLSPWPLPARSPPAPPPSLPPSPAAMCGSTVWSSSASTARTSPPATCSSASPTPPCSPPPAASFRA